MDRHSVEYMFREYKEIEENEKERILSALESSEREYSGGRVIPAFRCIPSRIIMQRIIMRATLLPAAFEDFVD